MEEFSSPETTTLDIRHLSSVLRQEQNEIRAANLDPETELCALQEKVIIANHYLEQHQAMAADVLVSDPFIEPQDGEEELVEFTGYTWGTYTGYGIVGNIATGRPAIVHQFYISSSYTQEINKLVPGSMGFTPLNHTDITILPVHERQSGQEALLRPTQATMLHSAFDQVVRGEYADEKAVDWIYDRLRESAPIALQDVTAHSSEVAVQSPNHSQYLSRGHFQREGTFLSLCEMPDPSKYIDLTIQVEPSDLVLAACIDTTGKHHQPRLAKIPLRSCLGIKKQSVKVDDDSARRC